MFNDSDDVVDKLVKFMLYLIPLCMVILMVMLLLWGLGVFNPSDKEISTSTENYIEIQLGKEYQLKSWEYEYITPDDVEISYIGVNEKNGKRIEVMEKRIPFSEVKEVISKDKTKRRLESKIEDN
ncbi:hypothetical protein LG489_002926 [Listeria monocytogenes]|uniref:hypothetical protein n=1 Tax=Listeria monocytogenes TaxID=1639 RepID=UPI00025489E1|nr:hypothetical protein [Listeria monocytogenes]EAC4737219.1 hypothetical protein [Listeria monocytogenes]EAC8603953.1 hypothetical protein [Listeria monocytogenes]EAE5923280.1 hypothetical protein [Listeria monocytogenes]EAE7928083.1 hypothetical protein [Listeria monocytogenes]EAE8037085.1 hypothetical protein [Listeria monocytogenes]